MEYRAAPRRGRRGSTVEALTTYAVTEFQPGVVRIEDRVGRGSREELTHHAPLTVNLRRCGGRNRGVL
jgi:hypothetical protein